MSFFKFFRSGDNEYENDYSCDDESHDHVKLTEKYGNLRHHIDSLESKIKDLENKNLRFDMLLTEKDEFICRQNDKIEELREYCDAYDELKYRMENLDK